MLDVLAFIFACVVKFVEMLFTVDVGFASLGSVMTVIFVVLPIILIIADFFKAYSGDMSFALAKNKSSNGGKK